MPAPRPTAAARPSLSRRVVLGGFAGPGLLVMAGLAGCGERPDDAVGRPAAGAGDSTDDPDLALLDAARAELAGLLVVVRRTRRRHAPLRGPLVGVQRAHATQLRVLTGELPSIDPTGAAAAAARTQAAVADLIQREDALRRRLTGAAVQAQSGRLAALLASAAAGTAQQQALLGRLAVR
ncbi:hypothetical protein [Nocardioides acrostichi]|uniref:Uncharacterized protein n=1 Tax=Nocardioides acrostichi TaxID=2784339 RepID=A0A930Y628_9ACTN|nr:hypothetical protein [Nocardioides acrostichi]MBF4160506.1 hypothetical protein [Nocardioides acrostichi]